MSEQVPSPVDFIRYFIHMGRVALTDLLMLVDNAITEPWESDDE